MAEATYTREQLIQYVNQQAPKMGLDPAAVLAVANQEGLGGGIGDAGTSFGPWQLHQGGALPSFIAALGQQGAQAWAWSQAGVDYALSGIADAAKGLTGNDAIVAIVTKFERPLNPGPEILGAEANLWQFQNGSGGSSVNQPPNFPPGTQTPVTFEPSPGSPVTVVGRTQTNCQDWSIALPGGNTISLPGSAIFCTTGNAIQSFIDPVTGFITNSANWWKIGLTILAAALIIAGIILYGKGELARL